MPIQKITETELGSSPSADTHFLITQPEADDTGKKVESLRRIKSNEIADMLKKSLGLTEMEDKVTSLKEDLTDTILRNICNVTPLNKYRDNNICTVNKEFLSATPTASNQYTLFDLPNHILLANHIYLITVTASAVKGDNITIVEHNTGTVTNWNILQNNVRATEETHTEVVYTATSNRDIGIYWYINTGETIKVKIGIYDITGYTNYTKIDFSDINSIYTKIKASNAEKADYADYAEKAGSIAKKDENIACVGDSLTYGYGANPGSTDYPTVLAKLCGKTVYNLGVSGESTDEILARQGGFPAIINPVNIPANTSNVEITFASTVNVGGGNTHLLRKVSGNLANPVVIDGVEGNISASNNKYYFARLKDGTAHEVKRPQYVITKEMREHKDDIQIIFMGTNGGWMITADDAETRIKKLTSQIDMMIDYNTSKKYIIIGMHYFYSWVLYNGLTKEQLENAMLLKYGNHYINLRKYMIEYGLADAGLTATEADTEAINNGNVPPSLLYSDGVHGNSYFYNILANLVNKKGIELGYWN